MTDLTAKYNHHMPPMMKLLGVEFVSVERTKVVGRLAVRAELGNANGVLHGGAFMAFADHVGAIGAVVNLPKGANTATIESKTNFFLPGRIGDTLTAEALPLHIGRKTMVWQTRITGQDGRLLAQVTQTQIVLLAERVQESAGS